jgi:hypothetical protein
MKARTMSVPWRIPEPMLADSNARRRHVFVFLILIATTSFDPVVQICQVLRRANA